MGKVNNYFSSALDHAGIVGSFLLPEHLKKLHYGFSIGDITAETLLIEENQEIAKLVAGQKQAGLTSVTDGEFHRRHWAIDFIGEFPGIEVVKIDRGRVYQPIEAMTELPKVTGKIAFNPAHSIFSNFSYLKSLAGSTTPRATIPSPAQFFRQLVGSDSRWNDYYCTEKELADDIATLYSATISRLHELGCRYIQLDDASIGKLCDSKYTDDLLIGGIDPAAVLDFYINIIDNSLAGIPDDMLISMHVCRGNHHSPWRPAGSFNAIAPKLFSISRVNRFLLEFDIASVNDFQPLSHLPEDKTVVLGILSSHFPQMENKEDVKHSIMQASRYVDLQRIGISPRCGFHSDDSISLTESDQWNKIKLLTEIAAEVWGHDNESPSIHTLSGSVMQAD